MDPPSRFLGFGVGRVGRRSRRHLRRQRHGHRRPCHPARGGSATGGVPRSETQATPRPPRRTVGPPPGRGVHTGGPFRARKAGWGAGALARGLRHDAVAWVRSGMRTPDAFRRGRRFPVTAFAFRATGRDSQRRRVGLLWSCPPRSYRRLPRGSTPAARAGPSLKEGTPDTRLRVATARPVPPALVLAADARCASSIPAMSWLHAGAGWRGILRPRTCWAFRPRAWPGTPASGARSIIGTRWAIASNPRRWWWRGR